MDIIKSFKVRMHMDYSNYEEKLKENPELMNETLTNFVTDMSNGPLEEVIKFFNLEDEDKEGLTDSNFAIGYKIVGEDADKKVLAVNIRLDIRVPEEDPQPEENTEAPSLSDMLASGLSSIVDDTSDAVVDSEGEIVMESDNTPSEDTTPEEPAVEDPEWHDAEPGEVPFENAEETAEE